MITREKAALMADRIHGARVEEAKVEGGVLVLELFPHGTDDGAYRIVVSLASVVVDEWPWPQP